LNLDEIACLPTAITPRIPVDGEKKGHPITNGVPIEIPTLTPRSFIREAPASQKEKEVTNFFGR